MSADEAFQLVRLAIQSRKPDIKNIVGDYLRRNFGSSDRADQFLALSDGMDAEQFWTILHQEWPGFDAINHSEMSWAFGFFADEWSADYLDKDDRHFFKNLSDPVTVYRGQSASNSLGLAWTTDYEVAKGFALGHRGYCCPDPVIFKATVSKENIAGAYTARSESEILVFSCADIELDDRIRIAPRNGEFEND